MRALAISLFLSLASTACSERNPEFCESDADCAGTSRPFCDVNGEFTPSNGTKNVCTETPADCPVERCGCTPGEALACDLDTLTVCATDGKSTTNQTCALGCSTEDRCLTFEPSNGLGPVLEMAEGAADVMIPAGARIDTDTGVITTASGASVDVSSVVVTQTGGPSIRAFFAGSFVLENVTAEGAFALAFVAHGPIQVTGVIDVSAKGRQAGPGAQEPPGACSGGSSQQKQNGSFTVASGAGGAGDGLQGASGGAYGTTFPAATAGAGGATFTGFVPLRGGCRGGSMTQLTGTVNRGGAGGGAIQLVSLEEIAIVDSGVIHTGGGGGESSAGGGSGGIVVLEAPKVRIEGAAAGVATNGGSGGGCGVSGANGQPSTTVAVAPKCTNGSAGDGGTKTIAAQKGGDYCADGGSCLVSGNLGGGGGGAGRVEIATRDGTFTQVAGPLLSALISTRTLDPR